jgi:hypothetical protein
VAAIAILTASPGHAQFKKKDGGDTYSGPSREDLRARGGLSKECTDKSFQVYPEGSISKDAGYAKIQACIANGGRLG